MTLAQKRDELRQEERTRFIEPEEFCELAVSSRKLVRSDVSAASVKGLYSPDDNLYYFVEEERLDNFRTARIIDSQPLQIA
ncbi:hypothetical protein [Blastopirellula marina]|uniref:Uncharacterized protein n=1 Tax=Blastopirellula marina TaxID=124 RepID=A0A2S8GR95_9BACT|nr:hypothetical protein [Blastopirellula marina]PQO46945.1 hypothetical protein C5Y93_07280 [Blastopirellula marina]